MDRKRINLTFISPPKKYRSTFNTETKELVINDFSQTDNQSIGKASFVNGNLFCYWIVEDKTIRFFYRDNFYSSDDPTIEIVFNEMINNNIKYMYSFQVLKEGNEVDSDIFVSQAYNSYLINVTYDEDDLEDDEILIYFSFLWSKLKR